MLAFPGAILPAWGYHLRPHYVTIGTYFLDIDLGLLTSIAVTRNLTGARLASVLTMACITVVLSFLALSFTAPPVAESWRLIGLFGLGFGAGALNTGILHAISPAYRLDPAATINVAGALFGVGSAVSALLVAGAFAGFSAGSILFLAAIPPAVFAYVYARSTFPEEPVARGRSWRDVTKEFTIPSAVLLSLLLFFHFGNEWAIAGWLPLFLILRLGMNPTTAVLMLMLYWLSLVAGRAITQAVLPKVSHGKLLLGSVLASMFGCTILTFTDNLFGAFAGTLLVGLGFAPIYPLVVEKIGARFPYYHPGFFNGIFSVALTGSLLAPATLGYAAEWFGIRVVMALPMIGSIIVFALVLLIWLESKFASPKL